MIFGYELGHRVSRELYDANSKFGPTITDRLFTSESMLSNSGGGNSRRSSIFLRSSGTAETKATRKILAIVNAVRRSAA